MIIDCIYRYLRCCSNDSVKIARKDYDIVNTIIADAKLQELEGYPNCIKQIETHFKIMATRWKYSGRLNRKDRNLEASLIGGKGNFIDLTKKGILSTYLLTQSNINDI